MILRQVDLLFLEDRELFLEVCDFNFLATNAGVEFGGRGHESINIELVRAHVLGHDLELFTHLSECDFRFVDEALDLDLRFFTVQPHCCLCLLNLCRQPLVRFLVHLQLVELRLKCEAIVCQLLVKHLCLLLDEQRVLLVGDF